MKGEKLLCVCVCVCVSLPVNRALIALALQLGDFQSKKNSGINNEGILKVLKCVIILCISIETFFAQNWHDRKSEAENEHKETAETEIQEDCTDQAGQMKFTLETIIVPYDKLHLLLIEASKM